MEHKHDEGNGQGKPHTGWSKHSLFKNGDAPHNFGFHGCKQLMSDSNQW